MHTTLVVALVGQEMAVAVAEVGAWGRRPLARDLRIHHRTIHSNR
jgi:hypothetical protein